MSRFVDTIITYRILRMLTQPFVETDAYRLGIIDAHGNVIKKELNSEEERDAYTLLNRMVFKLKRIIEKVPFENKRFLSFAAAVALIKENVDYDEDILEEVFYMEQEQDDVKQLAEDLEANRTLSFKEFVAEMGVAGGGVAGIGIPNPSIANQAEPGISKGRQKKYKKKNKDNSPAGLLRRK